MYCAGVVLMIRCLSPVDGSLYAERSILPLNHARQAVARAWEAAEGWAALPLETRITLVQRGLENLYRMAAEIIPELAWQTGRPVGNGDALAGLYAKAEQLTRQAPDALRDERLAYGEGAYRIVKRAPHGVVLAIVPWSDPFSAALATVIPGLIAGNAVMLKPASQTPLTGERIADAFHAAGVPADVLQTVFLDHGTVQTLIAERSFGFVTMAGSAEAGQAVERAAAGQFVALMLEPDGKNAGYVCEDADIEGAAVELVRGALMNGGQSHNALERLYVAAPVFSAFVERATEIVNGHILDDPRNPATTLGPMARESLATHIRGQIADALDAGATAHIDRAQFPKDGGAYLMPQILTGVTHGMRIMHEECFGPVLTIMPVASDAEAIALINDSAHKTLASLWTRDPNRAEAIADRIEAEAIYINRVNGDNTAPCRAKALCRTLTRAKSCFFERDPYSTPFQTRPNRTLAG